MTQDQNTRQSKRQTLQQKRAASAWDHIQGVEGEEVQKKYGSLARRIPSMIQSNGLASTLAFLLSKGKGEHQLIYVHISNWVVTYLETRRSKDLDDLLENVRERTKNQIDLITLVRQEDMDVYRRATTEAIEYSIWLKRYAEAKDWGNTQGSESP